MLGRCTRETFLYAFHQLSAYWDDALHGSARDASADAHCTTALEAMAALVRSLRPGRRAPIPGAGALDRPPLTRIPPKKTPRCFVPHRTSDGRHRAAARPDDAGARQPLPAGPRLGAARDRRRGAPRSAGARAGWAWPGESARPKGCLPHAPLREAPALRMPAVAAAGRVAGGGDAGGRQCAGHVVDAGGRAGGRVRFPAAVGCAEAVSPSAKPVSFPCLRADAAFQPTCCQRPVRPTVLCPARHPEAPHRPGRRRRRAPGDRPATCDARRRRIKESAAAAH